MSSHASSTKKATPRRSARQNSISSIKTQQQANSDVDMNDSSDDQDSEEETQGPAKMVRSKSKTKQQEQLRARVDANKKSSSSKQNKSSSSSITTGTMNNRHTRSITAAAKATAPSNAVSASKKRKQQKRRRQHENDSDAPYRPYSYIAKAFPKEKSIPQPQKKQKLNHKSLFAHTMSSDGYERKESDPDVEMKDDSVTRKRSKLKKHKSTKSATFQAFDRDALSHVYSYLNRVEFATSILVNRHWNRVGSVRACWLPFTRETLQRYVNSTVSEYDDSVLHPRRVEPKGIFDLQRLIRPVGPLTGAFSQVNDLAFDEEYYANPSPLIELTQLKNLTSLRYTLADCSQLNLFQPFAEVMSHRLLVLKLIMNRETQEDYREMNQDRRMRRHAPDPEEYSEARMKRHQAQLAPIGLLAKLRVLVTNTLPPDSILVKLQSLEFLQCPTDCYLHPYTARIIRYLSVRHQLRHVSLGGSFVRTVNNVTEINGNFRRTIQTRGRETCATNFIAILSKMEWKQTLKLMDEVEEEQEEKKEEEEGNHHPFWHNHPPVQRALHMPNKYSWYVDPIPADDANEDLPIAQLTSLWLGNNTENRMLYYHGRESDKIGLGVNDFISLFSMSTLRNLRCQVKSKRALFPSFAASDASTSIAATQLESLDVKIGNEQDFTALTNFTNLRHLSISSPEHRWNRRHQGPVELKKVLPELTRLRELTLSFTNSYIATETWEALQHLPMLHRLNIRHSGYNSKLYGVVSGLVEHLGKVRQLHEVHLYDQHDIYGYPNSLDVSFPIELLNEVRKSASWMRLHYHPTGDFDDSYRTILVHPYLGDKGQKSKEYPREMLKPGWISHPRLQRFRLYLHDPVAQGKVQAVCRVATKVDENEDVPQWIGWEKVMRNYETDSDLED